MRLRILTKFSFKAAGIVGMILGLSAAAASLARPQHRPTASQDISLRQFLQNYVGIPNEEHKTTFYSARLIDLRDDGTDEFIVYLSGQMWCGSGGCTMLILAPQGQTYRVVTKTTVTQLPIGVLPTKSNGWHDIAVGVRGGGIRFGYDAILCFDGESYPDNPSSAPACRSSKTVRGTVVLANTEGAKPLYE